MINPTAKTGTPQPTFQAPQLPPGTVLAIVPGTWSLGDPIKFGQMIFGGQFDFVNPVGHYQTLYLIPAEQSPTGHMMLAFEVNLVPSTASAT